MKLFQLSSKLLLPLVALIIIIFLIFLPEIIGIKTIEKREAEVVQDNQVAKDLDDAEKHFREDSKSAPAKASVPKEEGGAFEGLGLKIGRFLTERTGNSGKSAKVNPKQSKNTISKTKYSSEQLSNWTNISDPKIQNHLRLNLKNLDLVLTKTSVRFQNSRKDLLRFKELLFQMTQAQGPDAPAPQDVLHELEKQDLKITNSLLKELAPPEVLELWASVNMSSFYESNLPQRLKLLSISGFNPRMQIHDATYYIVKTEGQKEPKLKSIGLNFALLKEGVKEVKLFKNNILVHKLQLKHDRSNHDWSTFHFEVDSGKDIYSIYVYGRNKQEYVKHYRFADNFETLSLKEKSFKTKNKKKKEKLSSLTMLYASAEENTVGQINMIDELYVLQQKGTGTAPVDMSKMEKF